MLHLRKFKTSNGTLTCENDLAGDKDEKYDAGLHHTVDEARKQLGLITVRQMM